MVHILLLCKLHMHDVEREMVRATLPRRCYDPAAFTLFRDCSLADSAAAYAAEGEVACIEKLLLHHPVTVMPRLLEILDSIPETLPPRAYLHLLPKVYASVSSSPRHHEILQPDAPMLYYGLPAVHLTPSVIGACEMHLFPACISSSAG